MVAMVIAKSMLNAPLPAAQVNHLAYRAKNRVDYLKIQDILVSLGFTGYDSPCEDHLERCYFNLPGPFGGNTGLGFELQLFEEAISSMHLEVGLVNPPVELAQLGDYIDFGTIAPQGMIKLTENFFIHASMIQYITRTPGDQPKPTDK